MKSAGIFLAAFAGGLVLLVGCLLYVSCTTAPRCHQKAPRCRCSNCQCRDCRHCLACQNGLPCPHCKEPFIIPFPPHRPQPCPGPGPCPCPREDAPPTCPQDGIENVDSAPPDDEEENEPAIELQVGQTREVPIENLPLRPGPGGSRVLTVKLSIPQLDRLADTVSAGGMELAYEEGKKDGAVAAAGIVLIVFIIAGIIGKGLVFLGASIFKARA